MLTSGNAIILHLPMPVSANRYWRMVMPKGYKRPMMIVSPEAKAYKADVGWRAKAAGVREPLTNPIELRIVLVPKNGICMDLDNALKVTIDALKGIAYRDDSQVRKIVAERAEADGRGGLVVEITTAGPPAPEPMTLALDEPKGLAAVSDGEDPF